MNLQKDHAKNELNLDFSIKTNTCLTSSTISKDVLKEKYLQNGLSMRDIAKDFSCSKNRIRNLIVKYKIPIRTPSHYHKDHERQYGKKRVNGKVIDHKRELKAIEAIKKMYCQEKIKPNCIARLLDSVKIPTKRQGKGWRCNTIINILKKEGVYKPITTRSY